MKNSTSRNTTPDLREFIDGAGKKWVQTSTDDLFSMNELNEIFEKIEKERDSGEILLARIDFQKVNREYYDAALELQKKVIKQQELLKKVTAASRESIEKKNKKLKELIEYIRKLHSFIAYISAKGVIEEGDLPPGLTVGAGTDSEEFIPYTEVQEKILHPDENE